MCSTSDRQTEIVIVNIDHSLEGETSCRITLYYKAMYLSRTRPNFSQPSSRIASFISRFALVQNATGWLKKMSRIESDFLFRLLSFLS